jgi:hypothetical protein
MKVNETTDVYRQYKIKLRKNIVIYLINAKYACFWDE